ncbi:sporulation protein YlmC with PRC-barrel domain [Pseudorhizobium tarimense]|uniref:Sporulation protein YlmC with PRC-barrel domain n=1 Tax=Pseudorhizobium tarimense TaxID=1079109 RepID=A0ABV2H0V0_9HYPH|nr:PRC-barrel domain-containing protein [Pseudorhizobium tarimense]MCJ8517499.1 PRC-barrel domain-containing protein [Pseudorhizobium tarimense]
MKTIVLAAAATLIAASAFAQVPIKAPIVVLPEAVQGNAPTYLFAGNLDDYDIYGADGDEIGEVEDVLLNMDGTVAAVAVEVGGFLGIGEKDVLVDWSALEVTRDGDDVRITAPTLTREVLEDAQAVDLDKLGLARD